MVVSRQLLALGLVAAAKAGVSNECLPGDVSAACAKPDNDEEAALLALRQEVRRSNLAASTSAALEGNSSHGQGIGQVQAHGRPRFPKGRFKRMAFKNLVNEGGKMKLDLTKPTLTEQVLEDPSHEEIELKMLDIIDKHFADVDQLGEDLQGAKIGSENTWLTCANIDWPSLTKESLHEGTPIFKQMEEELGITTCWDSEKEDMSTTCKAIWAAFLSIIELQQEFPQGPKFHKAFISDWGKYPSWFGGSVIPPEPSAQMPREAKVVDPNGMNGFILCDIVRTILTQSPNQVGSGSCSFVASLGALSNKAPAKAIKSAIRLVWTGRHSRYYPTPCPNIYDMQPGMVPYSDSEGWHPDTTVAQIRSFTSQVCSGNPQDCHGEGRPIQPLGMVFAWYEATLSSYSLYGYGSCSPDLQRNTGLAFPGWTKKQVEQIALGGDDASTAWGCDMIIDPEGGSCRLHISAKVCGTYADEACGALLLDTFDPTTKTIVDSYLQERIKNWQGARLPELVAQKGPQYQARYAFWANVAGNPEDPNKIARAVIEHTEQFIAPSLLSVLPTFTEDMLAEVCKAPTALLGINAASLQQCNHDIEPYKSNKSTPCSHYMYLTVGEDEESLGDFVKKMACNHEVVLQNCYPELDTYTIWSWGTTYNMSKAALVGTLEYELPVGFGVDPKHTVRNGAICDAITAEQISFLPK